MSEQEIDPRQLSFENMVSGSQTADPEPEVEEAQSSFSLAAYNSTPEMGTDDVFIPRLKLAQGLTKEVQEGTARPGQWVMTGYEPADSLTIVPLLFTRQRRLTDDSFQTLCKSEDAVTGIGTPGGICAQCPMNQWVDGPKGRRIPPQCQFSYNYIVFVVEHSTLAVVEFKRTSIQAGKTLNTMVAQRGLGKFGVALRSTGKSGPKGTYHTAALVPVSLPVETLQLASGAI